MVSDTALIRHSSALLCPVLSDHGRQHGGYPLFQDNVRGNEYREFRHHVQYPQTACLRIYLSGMFNKPDVLYTSEHSHHVILHDVCSAVSYVHASCLPLFQEPEQKSSDHFRHIVCIQCTEPADTQSCLAGSHHRIRYHNCNLLSAYLTIGNLIL